MEKYPFLILSFAVFIIILGIRIVRLTRLLYEKNARIVQFNLDRKLISQFILQISKSRGSKEYYLNLIEYIKAYFQLDDFFILTGTNDYSTISLPFPFNEVVEESLQNQNGESKLEYLNITSKSVATSKGNYALCFYPYSLDNLNDIIIYTKKESCSLSSDEISTLKTLMNLLVLS